ncbi:MAG: SPFH domain-containing protein, partial [Propionibacteriaceae bacterium]|nr:SPFH domain-containing protein [Propionibacteriaceae bacterium]
MSSTTPTGPVPQNPQQPPNGPMSPFQPPASAPVPSGPSTPAGMQGPPPGMQGPPAGFMAGPHPAPPANMPPSMPSAPTSTPYPPGQPYQNITSPKKAIHEKVAPSIPGLLGLVILLIIVVFGLYCLYAGFTAGGAYGNPDYVLVLVGVICLVFVFLFQSAFTVVQPGSTKVLQFLGNYVGTIRATGLRMTYPFTSKRTVSVKVRNFETREIKVNDSQGNPVIIAAIIVWQVHDTAQSVFQVEYYEQFVQVQSEAALRHIATIHPYDNGESGEA